jgi:endothelin-converting enzyme/putative endopeptidase
MPDKKFAVILSILILSAAGLIVRGAAVPPPPQSKSQAQAATGPEISPEIPSFDANAIDRSVNPCNNFYQYACGNWMKNNPIPPDQSRWGRFNELAERNRQLLRGILEDAAANTMRSAVYQKIGDYYASCMDEAGIQKLGTAVLKGELDQIAGFNNKQQLPQLLAQLHRQGINVLFRFSSDQDFKDATQEIAEVDQGGLGLPDRDYYLKEDARSVALRKAYVQHVGRMFQLMGEPAQQAATDAQTVLYIETALARDSMDRVQRRDPNAIYHKMSTAELTKLAPTFAWNRYFTDAGAPPVKSLNVAVPGFFQGMDKLVNSTSIDRLKTYMRWQTIHLAAPFLPKAFVDENFAFYGKELTGQKELQARWKRCVSYADGDLGEALGQPYVEKYFGGQSKQHTLQMVHEIETALGKDIQQVDWMTAATKKQALIKLHAVANKIGYPNKWRDYSKLNIKRGDALGNSLRANAFEFQRQLNKIGKPVDREEWFMSPPTVNAYYNPQMNDINFPAGILQPPFFSKNADDAINYGGIGAVIGHELTHGFDDQGSQFDAKGNLRDWWTSQDRKAFDARTQCVANEYSGFEPLPGMHINGKLTLGENVADNGGVRLALMALMDMMGSKDIGPTGGFTPEQRFFLSFGQIWCENQTPESLRLRNQTDPHSPGKFRVDGVVQNMPQFQKAFGCKQGAPMVSQNACRVW